MGTARPSNLAVTPNDLCDMMGKFYRLQFLGIPKNDIQSCSVEFLYLNVIILHTRKPIAPKTTALLQKN